MISDGAKGLYTTTFQFLTFFQSQMEDKSENKLLCMAAYYSAAAEAMRNVVNVYVGRFCV